MRKLSWIAFLLLGLTTTSYAQTRSFQLETWDGTLSSCKYSLDAANPGGGIASLVDQALVDGLFFMHFEDNQFLKRTPIVANKITEGKFKLSFVVIDQSYNEYNQVIGETRYDISGNIIVDNSIIINLSYNKWFGATPAIRLRGCDSEKDRLDDFEIGLGDLIDDVTV